MTAMRKHGRQAVPVTLRYLAVTFACLIMLSSSTFAVEPDERLANGALETRARAISAELRCLVCQNQSIDDSSAPLARDLRVLVRERLLAGKSDTEVKRFLVERYGEFVLLRPRFNLQTALLWLSPVFVLALVGFAMWRRVKTSPKVSDTSRGLNSEEQTRLDQILAEQQRRD